jgi:hypothetical protein
LVYLFSKRPWSLNEQHEQHAGSFPVRHQSHLQRCAEMLSSQAHVSTQSAIGKREELCWLLRASVPENALISDLRGKEENSPILPGCDILGIEKGMRLTCSLFPILLMAEYLHEP